MNNYALDIERPEVSEAMKALGILPEELLKINPQEFIDPTVTEEIYNIRISHYKSKLQKTVQLIENYLNTRKKGAETNLSKHPLNYSKNRSPDQNKVQKAKEKNQIFIQSFLTDLHGQQEANEVINTKLELKKQTRNEIKEQTSERKQKIIECKRRQRRNFLEMKKKHERMVKSVIYELSQNTPRDSLERQSSMNRGSSASMFYIKEKVDSAPVEQLFKIEEKIYTSNEKLNGNLVARKEMMARKSEKVAKTYKFNEELKAIQAEKTLEKLMNKEKAFEMRKKALIKEQKMVKEEKEKKKIDKLERAKKRLKQIENSNQEKRKTIEDRVLANLKVPENKQEIIEKTMELRHEQNRLRDEDAITNIEREQRILVKGNEGFEESTDTRKIES